MFKWTPLALILGFVIDLLLGDPRMAVPPGAGYRKRDQFPGKKAPGNFSENTPGRTSGRTSYGDPAVYPGVCDPGGNPVSGL